MAQRYNDDNDNEDTTIKNITRTPHTQRGERRREEVIGEYSEHAQRNTHKMVENVRDGNPTHDVPDTENRAHHVLQPPKDAL